MTTDGQIDAPAHAVLTRILDWHQLRTLLSEAIGSVPMGATDRWRRIADVVNARCPDSRPQPADVFEHVIHELTRLNVPGAPRLETDPSAGRDIWTRVFYGATGGVFDE